MSKNNEFSFIKMISEEKSSKWFDEIAEFIKKNKPNDYELDEAKKIITITKDTGLDSLDEEYLKGDDLCGDIPSNIDSEVKLHIYLDSLGGIRADYHSIYGITMTPGKSYPDYFSKSMGQWYPGEQDEDEYSSHEEGETELDIGYDNIFEWLKCETDLKIDKNNMNFNNLNKAIDEFLENYVDTIKDELECEVSVEEPDYDYDDEPDDDY